MIALSAHELIPIICSALMRGQHVRFAATGGSMRPFIHDGEVVELEPLNSLPALGDVVLVRCGSGSRRYVLHRVVRVKGEKHFIRGDAQQYCEGPFVQEDVLGRVTRQHIGGHVRRLDSGPWHHAGRAWQLCAPLSVWLLHLAVRVRGDRKGSM
ncbi:MAG: S24/S26 family peptidase [Syntrophobacteraceae bacterium]